MRTEYLIEAYSIESHGDRKSTRLNSRHLVISYAVFCLKKIQLAWPALGAWRDRPSYTEERIRLAREPSIGVHIALASILQLQPSDVYAVTCCLTAFLSS